VVTLSTATGTRHIAGAQHTAGALHDVVARYTAVDPTGRRDREVRP
jgi:hypothetical protein